MNTKHTAMKLTLLFPLVTFKKVKRNLVFPDSLARFSYLV